MFTNKNTSDYREKVRESRAAVEKQRQEAREQRAADLKLLDKIWRPRKGIFTPQSVHATPAVREQSLGCAQDGYEHSVLTHDLKSPGFWRIHCAHERPKWVPCAMCRRDKKEAAVNFGKLQRGEL